MLLEPWYHPVALVVKFYLGLLQFSVYLLNLMLDESLSSSKLLLIELFLFKGILIFFQLFLYLPIFFLLVDLFEVLAVLLFLEPVKIRLARVVKFLGFSDLLLRILYLLKMPVDNLYAVIIHRS